MRTEWMYLSDALNNLMPNGIGLRGTVEDYEILNNTDPIPSDSEIDNEIIRLKAEYDAQAYSRNREAEYPSVQECVHAILDDDLTALQEKRQAVKTKYPKS